MFKKITVTGTSYEMGYSLGVFFKESISKDIDSYLSKLEDRTIMEAINYALDKLQNDLPEVYDELLGKADGAEVDLNALFLMHSPELLYRADGCTTAIVQKDDRVLFSHNEDDPGYNHENTALVRYEYADHYILNYTAYNRLAGCSYGFNSYGLAFSSNFILYDEARNSYLSRYLVARYLLNATSIDDVISRLRKLPTASPFSFNVVDTNSNEAINIENDYNIIHITEIEDRYARSNHFLNHESPVLNPNSDFRYKTARKLVNELNDDCTLSDVYNTLQYHEDDIEKCIFKNPLIFDSSTVSCTVANMSVDSLEKKVIITDFLDGTKEVFDL